MAVWNPEIDLLLTDSEDEDEFKRDYRGRDATIFVVDSNLYANSERFLGALDIIKGAFINGMLSNNKDLMGIIFANTEMSPEPVEPDCLDNIVVPQNCAVFLPPRQLTEPIVDYYLRFLSTCNKEFSEQFGIADNGGCGNFAAMIRLCVSLFDYCGYSLNNSRIAYITDRETPHPVRSNEYQSALRKATDLEGKEIEFYVVPMVNEFNYEIFYKEFLALVRDVELESVIPQNPEDLRKLLTEYKIKQDFGRHCLGHFNFSLGTNVDMSVKYYNFFQAKIYPRSVKLLRKDNSIVTQKRITKVQTQDGETMEFTDEKQVKRSEGYYQLNLGSEEIHITPTLINRIRNFHEPGMKLLGFKPKSSLPKNVYYKPCNFMYPDDQAIKGSKRLFRSLWQRCLDREKIVICLFMRKRKAIPRYVALVPVTATSDDNQALKSGDGFKIIYLPFADHIRHTDYRDWNSIENKASNDGVNLFKKIIKKLRIKFEPSAISDPTLETLHANLLGLALNIRTENKDSDEIVDVEKQNNRIVELLPEIEKIFGEETDAPTKRPAKEKSNEDPPAKVSKKDEDVQSYDFVESMIKNDTIGTCTVVQLHAILEKHFKLKFPKNMKKAELINKLLDAYYDI